MQERDTVDSFLTLADFPKQDISRPQLEVFNGHPISDAEREPFYYSDGEVQRRRVKKKETQQLFKGYKLNQLTIVKLGVYVAGEKTTGSNYKGGYLKDNAVITRYIDPKTGVWTQARDGRWPYRLLTDVEYHFNDRKKDSRFNSGEIISLPERFDTLKVAGDKKRREISRLKNGIRK